MNSNLKSRIKNIVFVFLMAVIYLVFINFLDTKVFFDYFNTDYFNAIFLLKLLSLIVLFSILLINIYSLAIDTKWQYFVFILASFLLFVYVGFDFFNHIKPFIAIGFVDNFLNHNINAIVMVLIQTLLIVNVFAAEESILGHMSRKKTFIFFIIMIGIFIGLSLLSFKYGIVFVQFIIYVLAFINAIVYLLKYLLNGNLISGSILFMMVIYTTVNIWPAGDKLVDNQILIRQFFITLTVLFLANAFYRQLFTFYFLEKEELNKQKDNYAKMLKKEIKSRTKGLEDMNELLRSEIDSAIRLQKSILPKSRLSFDGVQFISGNYACDKLSGDFFNIYKNDDENIGMYILDVSGHGINAALLSIFCYNYIRSSTERSNKYIGNNPQNNLKRLYYEFNNMNFPDELHLVIFMASYNIKTKILNYVSGGMNILPILVRKNGEVRELDDSEGFPICKMGEYYTPEYKSSEIKLDVGDRVIFFTDGLVDSRKGINLTIDGLKKIMVNAVNKDLSSVSETLKENIEPFVHVLEDDITYFVLEVN